MFLSVNETMGFSAAAVHVACQRHDAPDQRDGYAFNNEQTTPPVIQVLQYRTVSLSSARRRGLGKRFCMRQLQSNLPAMAVKSIIPGMKTEEEKEAERRREALSAQRRMWGSGSHNPIRSYRYTVAV
jgi:hypothetical protein